MQKHVMTKRNKILVMAFLVLFLMIMPMTVRAAVDTTLPAEVDGVITLKNDVELSNSLILENGKDLTINLNGYTLSAKQKVIDVKGGKLTVIGNGTIKENTPDYAPIHITGSTVYETTINVEKDVILEGWSGIMTSSLTEKNAKITINFAGKINAKNDSSDGVGSGIYINGNLKDEKNIVVKIAPEAEINSTGDGIYAAGYATWNIKGLTINSVTAGIALKSGNFDIDNANIVTTGEDSRPTEGYGNGINPSGAAIQIESNNSYAGNIKINIKNGKFESKNGVSFYEYLAENKNTTETKVNSIEISGGEFISANNKPVFALSNDLTKKITKFIRGGLFSSDINDYISDECCIQIQSDGKYLVKEIVDIAKCDITGISNKAYTGKALKQTIVISYNGETLKENVDYTIKYTNNTKPGKVTVTINGKGVYKGTTSKTFIITPKKLDGLKVDSQTTSTVKLSWTKHEGVTGYEIYSYNYSNKKWECIDKTSKNSYTIKKLSASTTYKYKVRAYVTIDKKQYYGSYTSNLKTATKPKTTKVKATAGDKKITIKWNKVSGVTGYQVYMATSKNGKYTKIKTIKNNKTFNYTKSGLNANKKYYFKVRAYKQVDDKKVCSSYTEIVSAKTKKVHVIKKGDTLYSIAKKNKTTVAKLAKINGLKKVAVLKIGYRLLLN